MGARPSSQNIGGARPPPLRILAPAPLFLLSIVLNSAWPYFHEEGADLGGCIQCSNENFEEFHMNSKLLSTLYVRTNDYFNTST